MIVKTLAEVVAVVVVVAGELAVVHPPGVGALLEVGLGLTDAHLVHTPQRHRLLRRSQPIRSLLPVTLIFLQPLQIGYFLSRKSPLHPCRAGIQTIPLQKRHRTRDGAIRPLGVPIPQPP